MSIPVTCPSCQYKFSVPSDFAGKRGKCPKCQMIFTAAAAPAGDGKPAAATAPASAKPSAPPVRLKTAKPLEEAPAPAPARPAPRSAPSPSLVDTVRAEDTSPAPLGLDYAPIVSTAERSEMASVPHAKPPSPYTARGGAKPAKSSGPNPLLFVLAGGGAIALLAVLGLIFAFGGFGGGEKPVAKNSKGKTNVTDKKADKKKTEKELTPLGFPDPPKAVVGGPLTLDEAIEGIVKIETPFQNGISLGTGFIINTDGWVATNYHVVDEANERTRVVIDGNPFPVEGLILKSPEHDMAIIKLAQLPTRMRVLEIKFREHPKRGAKIRSVGFPSDTFNITEGIVSNVATSDKFSAEHRMFLRHEMKATDDHFWIQHSSKLSGGNSGGPLLNEQNEVIGINTWVSSEIEVSYAGHVNHLKELMDKAPRTAQPFPKGSIAKLPPDRGPPDREPQLPPIPVARVRELLKACGEFDWHPTSAAQFNAMAELAMLVTMSRNPRQAMTQEVVDVVEQTELVFGTLTFDEAQAKQLNEFATSSTSKALGMMFVGTVVEPNIRFDDRLTGDRVKFEGVDRRVIVRKTNQGSLGDKDARFLIVGLHSPITIRQGNGEPQRLVVASWSKELEK